MPLIAAAKAAAAARGQRRRCRAVEAIATPTTTCRCLNGGRSRSAVATAAGTVMPLIAAAKAAAAARGQRRRCRAVEAIATPTTTCRCLNGGRSRSAVAVTPLIAAAKAAAAARGQRQQWPWRLWHPCSAVEAIATPTATTTCRCRDGRPSRSAVAEEAMAQEAGAATAVGRMAAAVSPASSQPRGCAAAWLNDATQTLQRTAQTTSFVRCVRTQWSRRLQRQRPARRPSSLFRVGAPPALLCVTDRNGATLLSASAYLPTRPRGAPWRGRCDTTRGRRSGRAEGVLGRAQGVVIYVTCMLHTHIYHNALRSPGRYICFCSPVCCTRELLSVKLAPTPPGGGGYTLRFWRVRPSADTPLHTSNISRARTVPLLGARCAAPR